MLSMFGLFFVLFLAACGDDNSSSGSIDSGKDLVIRGIVESIDEYGALHPSFTPAQMDSAGFNFADMLEVEIKSIGTTTMPYTSAYSDAGIGKPSLCDYNAAKKELTFGVLNGNFQKDFGGKLGDSIIVKMKERQGYAKMYELVRVLSSTDRSAYSSDSVFANFRAINTTGMKRNTLYRTSNAINVSKNPVRYLFADKLAENARIATEIDLANTKEALEKIIESDEYKSEYCANLFKNGNVIGVGWGSGFFEKEVREKLAEAFRFMINNNPPYMFHCNEGKDRAGFFAMVLEGLAGASVKEILNDYMVTYENYYKIKKDSEEYLAIRKITAERMLWLLANPVAYEHLIGVEWDDNTLEGIDPQKAAIEYLKDSGLSDKEIETLRKKISSK